MVSVCPLIVQPYENVVIYDHVTKKQWSGGWGEIPRAQEVPDEFLESMITEVFIYSYPLSTYLPSFVAHYLVAFEDEDNYHWTLEKNDKYVLLQRSEKLRTPLLYQAHFKRDFMPTMIASDQTYRFTVHALLYWAQGKKMLDDNYSLTTNSCQNFAKHIFNHLAKEEHLSSFLG